MNQTNRVSTPLRPQKSPWFALLLFGMAAVLSLILLNVRQKGDSTAILYQTETTLSSTSDEPPSPFDDDHWTDAQTARDVLSRWLRDSPGTPTITIPRREVTWVIQLTGSAARQATADQEERERRRQEKRLSH